MSESEIEDSKITGDRRCQKCFINDIKADGEKISRRGEEFKEFLRGYE